MLLVLMVYVFRLSIPAKDQGICQLADTIVYFIPMLSRLCQAGKGLLHIV